MVASVPQIPKIVHFTLGSTPVDFSEDITSARIVSTPGAVQKVVTLDGVTHQDAEPEAWSLELTCVQDWDSVRPGLAYYLFNHKGTKVPFSFNAALGGTSAGTTTLPATAGTVTLVAISYGGEANVFSESTVSLPIDGTPTVLLT